MLPCCKHRVGKKVIAQSILEEKRILGFRFYFFKNVFDLSSVFLKIISSGHLFTCNVLYEGQQCSIKGKGGRVELINT